MTEQKAQSMVFEMESDVGNVLLRFETLQAMREELNQMLTKMDEMENRSLEYKAVHYMEVHNKIKLQDELLKYVLADLEKDYENIEAKRKEIGSVLEPNYN